MGPVYPAPRPPRGPDRSSLHPSVSKVCPKLGQGGRPDVSAWDLEHGHRRESSMNRTTRTARTTALGLGAALAAAALTGLTTAPADAAPGTTSLAEVLAADGNRFDK